MVALLTPCLLRGGRENIIHYDSAIQWEVGWGHELG
jgi:hypothetical protein